MGLISSPKSSRPASTSTANYGSMVRVVVVQLRIVEEKEEENKKIISEQLFIISIINIYWTSERHQLNRK